jgi:5-hydroxyisourate hydrolase
VVHRSAILLGVAACCLAGSMQATAGPPAPRGPLTTHVLNTATGKPAAGMSVLLHRYVDGRWEELKRARTGEDGRVAGLYPTGRPLTAGVYRLEFDTGAYFKAMGQTTFYPRVEVIFQVQQADEHYHVPLLVSPFGYSTYRGS